MTGREAMFWGSFFLTVAVGFAVIALAMPLPASTRIAIIIASMVEGLGAGFFFGMWMTEPT